MFDDDLFPGEPPGPVGPRRNVLIGTCSWTDASLIKSKRFYPQGFNTPEKRLRYYATRFPVVEVDSSYFAMPNPAMSALWAERTPAAFKFNVKAFRLFTGHQTPPEAFPADLQPLLPALGRRKNHYYADVPAEIVDELWRRFVEALVPLKDSRKLGAVHFQFAPWVSAEPTWIEHVEHCVQRMAGHVVAIEFRNQSWLRPGRAARTLEWERGLEAVHVVVDEPQGVGNYAQGVWAMANPRLSIVRLHGRNAETWDAKGLKASSERFDYEYSDSELEDLAHRIAALAEGAFEVVVLMNVNHEDQGIRAAERLQRQIDRLPPEWRAPHEAPRDHDAPPGPAT